MKRGEKEKKRIEEIEINRREERGKKNRRGRLLMVHVPSAENWWNVKGRLSVIVILWD